MILNDAVDVRKIAASWVDESSHEAKDSDGEEVQQILLSSKDGDKTEVDMSKSELSACKKVALSQLLHHDSIKAAFCALLDFLGLWGGLELGNIQRHLALRCDEVYHTLYKWMSS